LHEVADADWDSVEGLGIETPAQLVEMATLARSLGLHIVNAGVAGLDRVKFNITLGNDAAEVPSLRRSASGGSEPSDADFENAVRTLDNILAFCDAHHIKGFHHAHLGTLLEKVDDAERLLAAAPSLLLLIDTRHLLAAGSDPSRSLRANVYVIGLDMFTSKIATQTISRRGIIERNALAIMLHESGHQRDSRTAY